MIEAKIYNSIKEIEQALQITLEEENDDLQQEHSYKSYHNRKIDNLTLSNLHFENLDALAPVFKMVNKLVFISCTIDDISALLSLEYVNDITFDKVIVPDVYQPDCKPMDTTYQSNFRSVNFKNMTLNHISCLLPISKNVKFLEFSSCTLNNVSEFNLLPAVHSLSFSNTVISNSIKEIHHKTIADKSTISLYLTDIQLNDFSVFYPLTAIIKQIGLYNCRMTSIKDIVQFIKLKQIMIDAQTIIQDRVIPSDRDKSLFSIKECVISEITVDDENKPTVEISLFDFRNLAAIAPYIKELSFFTNQITKNEFLKYFTQLETITFYNAKEVNCKHFLPVAHQIRRLYLDTCVLSNTASLKYYTKLEHIEIHDGYINGEEIKPLHNLERLLPLQHHLKKLILWEWELEGMEHFKAFTALESLKIMDVSIPHTEQIFSLPNLKQLDIDIVNKKPSSLNLENCKNLESLIIDGEELLTLTGLKNLGRLERLEIMSDVCLVQNLDSLKALKHLESKAFIDINNIGTIPTLETLVFGIEKEQEIESLEQFPNLQKLCISGVDNKNITIGKLDYLKVLVMIGEGYDTIHVKAQLPQLKKLELSCRGLTKIPDISKLTELSMLDLSESEDLENLTCLKHLKKLEYLNVQSTKIKDFHILNDLPHLKQINIDGYQVDRKVIKQQFKNQEIISFWGGPYVAFRVWEDDPSEL